MTCLLSGYQSQGNRKRMKLPLADLRFDFTEHDRMRGFDTNRDSIRSSAMSMLMSKAMVEHVPIGMHWKDLEFDYTFEDDAVLLTVYRIAPGGINDNIEVVRDYMQARQVYKENILVEYEKARKDPRNHSGPARRCDYCGVRRNQLHKADCETQTKTNEDN